MSAQEFKAQGNEAFKAQKFEESIDFYSKAIECSPSDHVLYSNRSGSHASMNNYEKALEDAAKCVELKGDWPKGYQRKGLAEFYLKKIDESISTYQSGLKIDPSNQLLKDGLDRAESEKKNADVLGGFGDNPQAREMLSKLAANPKTAGYLQDKEFVMKMQMCAQNPQLLSMFAQQDPRVSEAMSVMLGGIDPSIFAAMSGQNTGGMDFSKFADKAESNEQTREEPKKEAPKKQEAKKPTSSDPAEVLKNEGNEFYKKKEFDAALEKYDGAIELKPLEILFYNNKAAVYLEQNKVQEALETVDKAIHIAEDNMIFDFVKRGKIYARKAACFMKMSPPELSQALDWYNKSLVEDQVVSVADAKKKVDKLLRAQTEKEYLSPEEADKASERGKAFFLSGNFPDAMKEYQDAVKRSPLEAKYYFNRGVCFTKLMEWMHALNDFDKCLELDENYLKCYLKKGQCHVQMKQFHKAIPIFEEGIKRDPSNQELKSALQKAQMASYQSDNDPEEQKKRYEQAMKDPEIQRILQTPEIRNALQTMQQSPQESMRIMRDPSLAPQINKLIHAGVLKVN